MIFYLPIYLAPEKGVRANLSDFTYVELEQFAERLNKNVTIVNRAIEVSGKSMISF